MQDIRKPYTRSKSNRDLQSRVEEFEKHTYSDDVEDDAPVSIPVRKTFKERRNIDAMDMYPSRGRRATDHEEGLHAGRRDTDGIVYRDPRTRYERKRQSVGTLMFIGVLLLLIVGGSLLTFVFNHATVTIVPKHTDIADYRQPITFAREGVDTADTVLFTVATTSLSKSKALTLSETKKVESKATGKIIIYNNYSADSVRLIKNTRFESSAGKIYRINQSVTVPGKTATAPGSIEVTVYADSVGADYNSAPTDFTIPGFKGSAQYTTVYARSNGSLTGGASGNMSLASLADINAAKDELALELAQEVKDKISVQKMGGYIGLYSAVDIMYDDNETELLAGTTSTYEVTATGYLMFASASELATKIAKDIREYKDEPVRLDYTDKLSYTRKDADRIATSQSLEVLTEGAPRVVFLTDENALKALVVGKKRSDFTSLMKAINSIEGAEIGFSPLWLSSFPDDTSKISVVESLPKR
ncbi:MAG: hypothetical protein ACAH17_02975 [Candidatus Paceibacterota bacterium]